MLEIIAFIIVIPGVAAIARGRGGRPWLWGVIAALTYVIVSVLASVLSGFPS